MPWHIFHAKRRDFSLALQIWHLSQNCHFPDIMNVKYFSNCKSRGRSKMWNKNWKSENEIKDEFLYKWIEFLRGQSCALRQQSLSPNFCQSAWKRYERDRNMLQNSNTLGVPIPKRNGAPPKSCVFLQSPTSSVEDLLPASWLENNNDVRNVDMMFTFRRWKWLLGFVKYLEDLITQYRGWATQGEDGHCFCRTR